jgi:ribosomal protein RSM22 (predicted rRNA methylase)
MDIGSGSGSASFALLDWLARNRFKGRVELTCLDQSELALEYCRQLMDSVKSGRKAASVKYVKQSMCDAGAIAGKWDMVVSSYALNEVFQEADEAFSGWLKSVLESVSAGGLLVFCEPIEYDKFNRINAIREAVLGTEGFRITAPCLHMKKCPMISLNGGWCHDVRRWHPPETLRLLNRRLFRQIEHLKYSFIAARRAEEGVDRDISSARMIAPIKFEKGRSLMKGCAGDGTIRLYEVQDRELTKDQLEGLDALERGDLVDYQIERELRNGEVLRIKSLESLL